MNEEMIVKNFKQVNDNFLETAAANHTLFKAIKKNAKKIRGVKGAVLGLCIICGVVIAELAERKRSEIYLQEQIDDLKETKEKICDRCLQNEIRLNNLADDYYSNAVVNEDGGACDA